MGLHGVFYGLLHFYKVIEGLSIGVWMIENKCP